MPTFLHHFSFLNYFLIFSVLLIPFPAGALGASEPSAPKEIPSLAVFELYDGRVKDEDVEKVTDLLREALIRGGKYQVISKVEMESFLNSHPDLLYRIDPANPLNRYLDQAKEFYKTFSFKEAIGVLENTIETYRFTPAVQSQHFLLTEAYLMLGNIQLGAGHQKKAVEAFREAVRLDPEKQITEMQYPPKTVHLFQATREEFLRKARSAVLEIQSSPSKSDVYLNGTHKGQTPLKIERLTLGEHYLLVKREGYQAEAKKIVLKSQGFQEKFFLKKNPQNALSATGLKVSQLSNVTQQVQLGTALGHAMGVDKIVLVSVEEIGWNHKITSRMIDLKYGAAHKHKSVEVLNLQKDSPSATQILALDLEGMADIDLAKNPKKYAESEVVIIGKKRKRSFVKSPILWSVVGALVAGGAASALLLSGGSGGDNTSTITVNGAVSKTP